MRRAARAVLLLVGAGVAYVLAAIAFALLPQPGRHQAADARDVPFFVCATLAHTDLVMPVRDPLVDWSRVFPQIAPPVMPLDGYVAFGWGDLAFYQATPRWADLRPGPALGALLGLGPSALHVVFVANPAGVEGCQPLALDGQGRAALVRHVLDTTRLDGQGQAIPAVTPVPGAGRGFYVSSARYSPWRTCNEWTAAGLRSAGVPTAYWAPFPFSVTWPLR